MSHRHKIFIATLLFFLIGLSPIASSQENGSPAGGSATHPGILDRAVMCEKVTDGQPVNTAVIFPVSQKEVFCFTEFSSITKKDVIVHNWIRHDETVARIKLTVEPPRWATYSGIALRDIDQGPWRVEITDASGAILKTLRFSITQ
ncbi:MAG: DUF2914 domain-containing protein [Deltaproteobacteria bacterium]|nr:DUF2914 domain-containing protein [Deltaproteobacteria bacterium]